MCAELILMQEVCLQRSLLPDVNILDLGEDVIESIEMLDQPEQRALLIQGLTFCQMRDGEIKSNASIQDG